MSKTILIVDDSGAMRQVVKLALVRAGYEVLEASHGKDALKQLDGRKVNLVISDVNMPEMDGITFLKEMKKLPAYKFTPFIMLTTEGDESKKREGQAAGARAWIVKPFQTDRLLDAVSKVIAP